MSVTVLLYDMQMVFTIDRASGCVTGQVRVRRMKTGQVRARRMKTGRLPSACNEIEIHVFVCYVLRQPSAVSGGLELEEPCLRRVVQNDSGIWLNYMATELTVGVRWSRGQVSVLMLAHCG